MMLRRNRKFGFTLLELMIALGLLGALLAVAWALLGTFRDAEMRGWKLSFRTQTIRSVRNWLEGDLQHLVLDAAPKQPMRPSPSLSISQASPAAFRGNEAGFTATISPSIDPIPFLGNLMSDSSDKSLGNSGDETAIMEGLGEDAVPQSLWPADSVEIEYELVPMDSNDLASSGISDELADKTQYALVRREQLGAAGPTSRELPAERVLSVQDLYRQEGAEMFEKASATSETRLEGLVRPQFRYFDGVAWSKQWDSSQRQSVPRAIAFGFDFPAAKDLVHPSEKVPVSDLESDRMRADSLTTGTMLSPQEPIEDAITERTAGDNQGIMISSTNEVQMVIYIGGRSNPKPTAFGAPIPNAIPRGQPR